MKIKLAVVTVSMLLSAESFGMIHRSMLLLGSVTKGFDGHSKLMRSVAAHLKQQFYEVKVINGNEIHAKDSNDREYRDEFGTLREMIITLPKPIGRFSSLKQPFEIYSARFLPTPCPEHIAENYKRGTVKDGRILDSGFTVSGKSVKTMYCLWSLMMRYHKDLP